MMGMLMTPTSARTAPARSARRGSSMADCKEMKPMYKNIKISVEVIRASHTHQVPQVGLPQSDPVMSERKVNIAPVIEIEEAIMADKRALKAQPIPA